MNLRFYKCKGICKRLPKGVHHVVHIPVQTSCHFSGFETPFHNQLDPNQPMVIKHILHLDDRETIAQITENMYLQYFLGYSSYIKEAPFDPSLFVDIRKRLGEELIHEMNEKIHEFSMKRVNKKEDKGKSEPSNSNGEKQNKGEVIFDATACPQDITYPTDLGLLNKAREITEGIIDKLHESTALVKTGSG